MGDPSSGGGLLTHSEIAAYDRLGYIAVDRPLLAGRDLEQVRRLLDALHRSSSRLPRRYVRSAPPGDGHAIEINHASALEPLLLRTGVAATCTAAARQLLGADVQLVFDHAIYKGCDPCGPVLWHQDLAYTVPGDIDLAIWVPLQAVTRESGCMGFVPRSHRAGPLRHENLAPPRRPPVLRVAVDEPSVEYCPLSAGGFSIHHPLTVHASAPNEQLPLRRAWILNFGRRPPLAARTSRLTVRLGALGRMGLSHGPERLGTDGGDRSAVCPPVGLRAPVQSPW